MVIQIHPAYFLLIYVLVPVAFLSMLTLPKWSNCLIAGAQDSGVYPRQVRVTASQAFLGELQIINIMLTYTETVLPNLY